MTGYAYGYDGHAFTVGHRVEIHPSTDLWMRGARFGTVKRLGPKYRHVSVKLDHWRKPVYLNQDYFRSAEAV